MQSSDEGESNPSKVNKNANANADFEVRDSSDSTKAFHQNSERKLIEVKERDQDQNEEIDDEYIDQVLGMLDQDARNKAA